MKVCNWPQGNLSRILAILLLLIGSFSACSKVEKIPDGTIPEEKMAAILTEIHIAEARTTKLQLKSIDSSIMVFNKVKADIWKKHKVDSLSYQTSYDFYVTHPKFMKSVYSKVNEKLEKREKSKNIQLK